MNDVSHSSADKHGSATASDSAPGVPGFRSWRGVYLFVLACFVLTVALLAFFTRVFSGPVQ